MCALAREMGSIAFTFRLVSRASIFAAAEARNSFTHITIVTHTSTNTRSHTRSHFSIAIAKFRRGIRFMIQNLSSSRNSIHLSSSCLHTFSIFYYFCFLAFAKSFSASLSFHSSSSSSSSSDKSSLPRFPSAEGEEAPASEFPPSFSSSSTTTTMSA